MFKHVTLLLLAAISLASGGILYQEEFDDGNLDDTFYIDVVPQSHNNELQYYTDRQDNVRVEDGHLVISPLKENYGGKQYTSGKLRSKFAMKYGRMEVRAKLPNGYGLWPAIWMMPRDSVYGGWPQSGEIDIMEARGQYIQEITSTIHYGVCCDNHYWESSGAMDMQCSIDQYHVYSVDWTPTELVYRLDGKAYYRQSLDRIIGWMYKENGQPFDQYFYLILNTAVGGDFLDNPKPNTVYNYPEAEMWVDYVRVYPLEDISTYQCAAKADASPSEICGNVNWACFSQNYADVSAQCTSELISCCSSPTTCDSNTLLTLSSAVFNAYDSQLNSDTSCDFSGTAERQYVLNDGTVSSGSSGQCLIKDGTDANSICGSMEWACYSQNYADVSSECNGGNDVLSCCGSNPYSCDYNRLRTAAQAVFQSYYNQIPSADSCDFGGICYVDNPLIPLECYDGYGA